MNEKDAAAVNLFRQLIDQSPLTGPQRRTLDAAAAHLETVLTPKPATPAPAGK